jgi:hypothetical protein
LDGVRATGGLPSSSEVKLQMGGVRSEFPVRYFT